MPTATEMLELVNIGQRTEGMRFELRDANGVYLGPVTPQRVVSVENNSQNVLKRSISNFVLPPSVASSVDMIANRVWAYWVLSDGTEYPLGQFLFAAAAKHRFSYGLFATTKLLDQGLILAQPLPYNIGFAAGTLVTDAIASVFDQAGFHTPSIAASSVTTTTPVAWPAGSSSTFAKVLSDLCGLAGLGDWYFSNSGQATVIDLPDMSTAAASLVYPSGGRIIAGSAVEESDLLAAPNRYLAIDTSASVAPVSGIYDLPDDAPNSFKARGFYITQVIAAPGVGSNDAARAYAQSFAQTDQRAHELVSFSASPDPRHDTFDVVSYLGNTYQELGWTLAGAPGGPHLHKLKRVITS